jgi:hypothetical protein
MGDLYRTLSVVTTALRAKPSSRFGYDKAAHAATLSKGDTVEAAANDRRIFSSAPDDSRHDRPGRLREQSNAFTRASADSKCGVSYRKLAIECVSATDSAEDTAQHDGTDAVSASR